MNDDMIYNQIGDSSLLNLFNSYNDLYNFDMSGIITITSFVFPLFVILLGLISFKNRRIFRLYLSCCVSGFILYILSFNNNYEHPIYYYFKSNIFILVLALIFLVCIGIYNIIYFILEERALVKKIYRSSLLIFSVVFGYCIAYLVSIFNLSYLFDNLFFVILAILLFLLFLVIYIFRRFNFLYFKAHDVIRNKKDHLNVYKSIVLSPLMTLFLIIFIQFLLPFINNMEIELFETNENGYICKYNPMFLPYEIVFEGDEVDSSYSYRYNYDQYRQVVAYKKFDNVNNKLIEYGSTSCDSLEKRIALADKYSSINPNCSIFYIKYGEKDEYYSSKTYYSRISSPEFTSSDILTVYVNIDFCYSSLEAMSKYTAYPEKGEYYSCYRNKDGSYDELYRFN